MTEFEEKITISAPREKVWDVLADIGSISIWNPPVVDSKQTSSGEVRLGSKRLCDLGGKNYLDEEVVEFEKPQKLTMRITDTNMPFKTADIHFTLESQGDNETFVMVAPKYELKFGLLGKIMDALMVKPMYQKGMKGLLRGLKKHVEQG